MMFKPLWRCLCGHLNYFWEDKCWICSEDKPEDDDAKSEVSET